MNYIYDVLLNFNNKLYEFYDWNKSDDVKHIRRIPIFKITTNELLDIKNNKISIEKNFLDLIINKTEYFSNRKIEKIKYSCIFSDGAKAIGVLFNSNGESVKYSSMLIDEEIEVNEICVTNKKEKINYNKINKNVVLDLKTRLDIEKEEFILNEIKVLKNNKKNDKLKYIYYDCFDKKEESISKIIDEIKLKLKQNDLFLINKLYDLLKIKLFQK